MAPRKRSSLWASRQVSYPLNVVIGVIDERFPEGGVTVIFKRSDLDPDDIVPLIRYVIEELEAKLQGEDGENAHS